jgi:hypothetical protein
MSQTSVLKSIAFTSSPVLRDQNLTVEYGQGELHQIQMIWEAISGYIIIMEI